MLVCHRPNVSVLREETTRRRPQPAPANPGATNSASPPPRRPGHSLVFASLLRDCLAAEFADVNVERAIDDLIVLMCLVGNDFLPTLPSLYIANDGLAVLFEAYKVPLFFFFFLSCY